jgi:alkylation response protein AidB-like acyl-CoA dehydrogenase
VFEDQQVPAENLLGGSEGMACNRSWSLEVGRINIASRCRCRPCRLRMHPLPQRANVRQNRSVSASHPAKLADMATKIEAARLLVRQAARRTAANAAISAAWPSCLRRDRARSRLEAMRVLGGYGYTKEFPSSAASLALDDHRRGTNEIQRTVIARQIKKYAI